MSNLKYWIWLSERKGMSPITRHKVLECFGAPEDAYFADDGAYGVHGLTGEARRSLNDKSMDCVDQILEDCERLGLHIMTVQDAIYPGRLRAIHQPPLVLYWKGRELALDEQAVIGMVGTRDASDYGKRMAEKLAGGLTRAGAVVVSGTARGIDGASLTGALRAGGPVVSVLGNGHDVIYPAEHRQLYDDVARAGMLLSEYPPGTRPLGSNFPVRNRIISGLSVGVVVVESPRRGGSLITANHALEQDRELFAVPGWADSDRSEGTNNLIQEGAAKLVRCAEDILCEFRPRFPNRLGPAPQGRTGRGGGREVWLRSGSKAPDAPQKPKTPKPAPKPAPERPAVPEKALDDSQSAVYIEWTDCKDKLTDDQRDLLLALKEGALVADELVERTSLPARRVLAALTILQVQGMVEELGGKRFQSRVKFN